MTGGRKTAITVLALVAIVLGAAAAINALSAGFLAERGAQLWRLFAMNTFGGLATVVLGVLALGTVVTGNRMPALLAGLAFLLVAALTLVRMNESLSLFGGRASTLSFLLMLGIGLVALVTSPEVQDGDA